MKRRYICFLLIFVLIFSGGKTVYGEETDVPEETTLYAKAAVLLDGDSGRVLYGKNESEILPMASTTKIMTCILALEYGNFSEPVMVTAYAQSMPKVHLGMREGETYKMKDLLYSLMLESHNDSAVAIAEQVAGSVESFADMMNQKAEEIGCSNTWFITPNGLDAEEIVGDQKKVHSTTAEDLARILRYCIMISPKREEFLEITSTQAYSFSNIEGTRQFSCNNHNALLTMMEGAISGKTGFTGNAGYCYTGAVKQGDKTLIVALLACGWPNNKGYKWQDTKKLITYGMKAYNYGEIAERPPVLQPIPVKDSIGASVGVEKYIMPTVTIPEMRLLLSGEDSVRMSYRVATSLSAPVQKGEKVGEVIYYLNEEPYAVYEILASESAEKRNWKWCLQQVWKGLLSTV